MTHVTMDVEAKIILSRITDCHLDDSTALGDVVVYHNVGVLRCPLCGCTSVLVLGPVFVEVEFHVVDVFREGVRGTIIGVFSEVLYCVRCGDCAPRGGPGVPVPLDDLEG